MERLKDEWRRLERKIVRFFSNLFPMTMMKERDRNSFPYQFLQFACNCIVTA